jgi:hypothetical protein
MMDDEMRTIKRPALGRSWLERNWLACGTIESEELSILTIEPMCICHARFHSSDMVLTFKNER